MMTYDCYVSFCEQDVDRPDLELLATELRSRLPHDIRLHVYFEDKFGAQFDSFIAGLDRVPAVIVLFTPEYKSRIDVTRSRTSGVYKEYSKIVERLEPGVKKHTSPLLLIPILWKGANFEFSLPTAFLGTSFAANLRDFHAHKLNGVYTLPRQFQSLVSDTLDKIAKDLADDKAQLDAADSERGRELRRLMIDDADIQIDESEDVTASPPSLVPDDVFQIKYEKQLEEVAQFREKYFVSTSFFRRILNQDHYIFSGRKGSGKTTLAQILMYDNKDKYLPPIDIQVNDWRLHAVFDDVILNQISGDLRFIQTGSQLFTFAWVAFIGFCLTRSCIAAKLIEIEEISNVIPRPEVETYFRDAMGRYRDIFQISFLSIKLFSDYLIEIAPKDTEERFRFFLKSNFTMKRFGEFIFGENQQGLRHLQVISAGSRVLFCLDRFDTELQEYRKEALHDPDDAALRREVNWLKGLVIVLEQCKSRDRLTPDTEIYNFFSNIDFFVILPRDRFEEVKGDMRDSISVDKGVDVRWKPIELMTMLRRRLALVAGFDDKSLDRHTYKTPRERFDFIIKRLYPEFPSEITIRVDHAQYPIDLFLGILRHTFWRPRDIMIYYLPILQRLERYRDRALKTFDNDVVRGLISQTTREIVNREFIQEFSDSFRNLPDVLRAFKGQPQVHDFAEISKILEDISFDIVNRDQVVSVVDKLEILYDIGFIGLKANKHFGNLVPTNDFTFSFMRRERVVDFDAKPLVRGSSFAIHPVFVESLFLVPGSNPGGGGRPVCHFDWNFIDANDTIEIGP